MQRESIKKLMEVVNESVENIPRFNRELRTHYTLMVIGIPNVGKSSLVNAIRKVCAGLSAPAKVGPTPGVTRAVQEKVRIQSSPLIYLLDTPGILMPTIRDTDVAMKIALCETVLQHRVGSDLIADYLLYLMNKTENFKYMKLTDMQEPTDDIKKLLFEIAIAQRLVKPGSDRKLALDTTKACERFLDDYRMGRFGCQFMDWEFLENS